MLKNAEKITKYTPLNGNIIEFWYRKQGQFKVDSSNSS